MKVFSFFQFVNSLKNIYPIDEKDRKDILMHLTLKAMNMICPNSYMPFVFMYAGSMEKFHFVHMTDNIVGIPKKLTLTFGELDFFLKKTWDGRRLIREAYSDYKRIGITHDEFVSNLVLRVIFDDLGELINKNDDPNYTCFWDFRIYMDSNPNSDYYYPLNNNALNIGNALSLAIKLLEEVDPFFNTDFDKTSYFILACILRRCLIETPNDDESCIDDDIQKATNFYETWEKWYKYYDKLIMQKYLLNTHIKEQIPEGLTRIVNGLLFDAQKHPMFDPFNNFGVFALNVNAQMGTARDQKNPTCFYSLRQDNDTIVATTLRLLFRGCGIHWSEPEESIKKDTYYVAMAPSIIDSSIKEEERIFRKEMIEGMEYARLGSKMVCILPSCFLVSDDFSDIRKKLVETKYEVKILSLPKETISTYKKAISIIFVDGNKKSDYVKFVDGFDYVADADEQDPLNATNIVFQIFERPDFGNVYINYTSLSNLCYHDEYPDIDEETGKWSFMFGFETWNENCYHTEDLATDEFGDRRDLSLSKDSFEHDIRIIKKNSIIANATLNPSFYFNRPVVAPIGYEVCRLSELMTPISQTTSSTYKGKVVSTKDLRNVGMTYEVNVQNLPVKTTEVGSSMIDCTPSILISKLGLPHPSLIRPSEKIFADSTLHAFNITSSTVNAEYLISEMHREDLTEQIRSAKIERGLIKDKKVTLNALKIYMPLSSKEKTSLDIQKDIVERELSSRLNELSNKYEILSEQRFSEYIMALRQRKHRLSQILNQVCPAFNLLNRVREKNNGILKDSDIVASRTGENVAQYFGKVQQGLDKIEHLVETLVDKNQWGKAEKVYLEEFITHFSKKHICKNYSIMLSLNSNINANNAVGNISLANHIVLISKDELSTVFENILANAETWGFDDEHCNNYFVKISLEDADGGDNVVIKIANNGTPIHPSVDRVHIFDWGVGSHTGVGTWQAKNIVEHYGGHIKINEYPKAKDGFQTEYVITLPREY